MLLHWSKNFGGVPTYTTEEDNGAEVKDCNTSGMPFSMAPFFRESVELVNKPRAHFLATLMTIRLSIKVRFFSRGASPDFGTCHFSTLNWNLSFGLALAPHRGWRLGQSKWKLFVSLCHWPVEGTWQANLTRRNGILSTVKEGNWEAQT